ncbi:Uncharacterised protein [Collinsella intestinalis]|nr:Uncharacterised protein [Collinsella intestinalis]
MVRAVIDVDAMRLEHDLGGGGHLGGGGADDYLVHGGLARNHFTHSAVILFARALPARRESTLNRSTQIISKAAVPHTICWASGLPSP